MKLLQSKPAGSSVSDSLHAFNNNELSFLWGAVKQK